MGIAQLFKKTSKTDGGEPDFFLPPKYKPVPKDTKIKTLQACSGSSDGINVERFQADTEYKVSAALADALVDAGMAQRI
jgi:hypothetical protein